MTGVFGASDFDTFEEDLLQSNSACFFRWKTGIVLKVDLGIEWVEILLIDRVYHQKVVDFEANKIDGNTMGDTEKPM